MKKITVKWVNCSEEDKRMFGYKKEMIVIKSDHKRFVTNTRFDFGFLQISSDEGYTIEINPL